MSLQFPQLIKALKGALTQQWPQGADWQQLRMEPLAAKGLAHDHVRLLGTGWLARVPKQSQMQLSALDNLNYQQTCFDRASPAGHAPRCLRVLLPCTGLPRGALIVQEIVGRAAQLPHDTALIARGMAALHCIALPPEHQLTPLQHAADPLQAMWQEIQAQAAYLPQAELAPAVAAQIHHGLARLQEACQRSARPLKRLIAFDGHPGNFVISASNEAQEKAYLVDLEKCRYSYPSFDLAHATLYTSTTWDIDSHTILSPDQVIASYRAWASNVDPLLALDAQLWHLPLRRAMWLWSLTWCAKWRVASRAAAALAQDGEDWSAHNLDPALAHHVRERVDHYLSESAVSWVNAELDTLQQRMADALA